LTFDLQIPDSSLSRQAEELVRLSSPAFLTNHCFRSHAWSVALAARDDVRFDAELLYIAALLHDLGLVSRFDTGRCFEEDGAAAAAALAALEGCRTSGARHSPKRFASTSPSTLPSRMGSRPTCFGTRRASTSPAIATKSYRPPVVAAVIDAYPRLDFKRGFSELIGGQAARKPRCGLCGGSSARHRRAHRGVAVCVIATPAARPHKPGAPPCEHIVRGTGWDEGEPAIRAVARR
jgi:hypothetical protein